MSERRPRGVDPALIERTRSRFAELFGPGARTAVAPGRVNLIGEHTDYNDGFVLPMAIGRAAVVVFRRRSDRILRAHSVAFDETRQVALDGLAPGGAGHWLSYVAGVAWAFAAEGLASCGLDLVVDGDVPIGAGLSSSAALELATARALAEAAAVPWQPVRMAQLCQRAENGYVGMNCGIMDQFASAACEAGRALLLDCRSLETRPVPVPERAALVVMDTGARRALAASAYNERRAACERVVAAIARGNPAVRALRDVSPEQLAAAQGALDPLDARRAAHVVAENFRPLALAKALADGDLTLAGRLMDESHFSLRDLYEVSCPELDLITEIARRQPCCYGARMTGAGFGGCAVALVDAAAVEDFGAAVLPAYRARFELPAALYPCWPEAGARLVD